MSLDKDALDRYILSEPPDRDLILKCDYSKESIEPLEEEALVMENGDLIKVEYLDEYIKHKLITSVVTFKRNGDYMTVKSPEKYYG